jgi:hypothetical protein
MVALRAASVTSSRPAKIRQRESAPTELQLKATEFAALDEAAEEPLPAEA